MKEKITYKREKMRNREDAIVAGIIQFLWNTFYDESSALFVKLKNTQQHAIEKSLGQKSACLPRETEKNKIYASSCSFYSIVIKLLFLTLDCRNLRCPKCKCKIYNL